MRRTVLVVVLLLCIGAAMAFAQADTSTTGGAPAPKEQEISLDVVPPLVESIISIAGGQTDITFSAFYRHGLSENTGFCVGPSFEYRGPGNLQNTINLWADFDVYPFTKGLKGFFLGPQVLFSIQGIFAARGTNSTVGLGAVVGYLLRVTDHVSLDAAAGVALGASYVATTNTYGLSVVPRINLALGYVP